MKMADAKQKRNEQLKRWIGSETDIEPSVLKKKKTKVKFDDGAVFLAACSSGDTEEVLRMLDRGADINYPNVDGLTALHQACIDDNVDMVTFLVEHGACINQPDNEGWIPLHAAASCGYLDIAEYLISKGANVSVVNSEGETPLDIAEEEAMEELLQNEINRQGIDIEAARKEEERIMLRDARQWLNSGQINDVRHAKSGGTALHVAAAKGYTEVLKLLIQAGYDVNIKDYDGWSPFHAAAHWGKEDACRILVENLCDMDIVNKVGQTAFDVADEDILGYLEELQKKQNLLLSDKKDVKKSPLIETTTTGDNNQSVKPLKSKETLLLEPKTAPRIETLEPEKVDEEEGEGKKDESSCSSEEEEEEDSESENEADKTKSSVPTSNSNPTPMPASITILSPTTPTNQVTTPTSPTKKSDNFTALVPGGEPGCPALWRQGLRKTGISLLPKKAMEKEKTRLAYVAPTIPRRHVSTSDIDEKENRDSAASLVRSGSYTRRRWEEDLKNSDGTSSLNRTSSYQRSTSHTLALGRTSSSRDLPAKSPSASSLEPNNSKSWQPPSSYQPYSIHHSSSYGRRHDDALSSTSSTTSITTTTTSTSSVTSPTGHRSLLSRYWAEESADKEKEKELATVIPTINTAATSTTGIILGSDGRERRRSYLTPVRDEESESQRKARSRQARQSRRSTQGVTLTDLQEAEKTIGRARPTRPREDEKEEKEKQDKEKQEEKKETETKDDDYRSRYRSFEEKYRSTSSLTSTTTASSTLPSSSISSSSLYSTSALNRPNSLTGLTSNYIRSTRDTERESDRKEKDEDKDGDDKSQPRSIRDRRRPREKRRSTGVSFWNQDSDENDPEQLSDSEEGSTKGETQSDRLSRYDPVSTSASDRDVSFGISGIGKSRRPYSRLNRDDATDYKKLYEQILAENEKLKAQLRDTELELSDLKLQLEKATQRQERFADRSQLELEKRVKERRALERKISEMEEELKNLPQVKQVQSLRQYNERLQAENRALARVLSKLSQGCSHLPATDL
ncbi:protein phosphatase 1 regulatory subunit 12A isoform X12 [Xyrauchen texanus]|uniref:protein phosphatase 1 regulatory subunit 12A isoform X12 n=1 Tax=Xyrauchen texanus TaxID=154827 RepID=UPI002241E93B|nr:protein phosphatase 1 regulatory subunit 12A isoform X12 [Xyrauchen texanus]